MPHLRNLYQELGRYSSSPDPITLGSLFAALPLPDDTLGILNPPSTSLRGYGFLHDGSRRQPAPLLRRRGVRAHSANATQLLG